LNAEMRRSKRAGWRADALARMKAWTGTSDRAMVNRQKSSND
jgi:hypothetical protein